jgi:uncharacterized LabA/DUF88 family protein
MPRVPFRRSKQQKPAPAEVYAFIDSQNLNVGTQKNGWKMDWRKFRQFLSDKYGVTKAFMFIGYMPEFEDMYLQLHDSGYMVVLKTTYDMTRPYPELQPDAVKKDMDKGVDGKKKTEEDEKHIKGNIDADLVLWAMKEFPKYKKAVLVSGDGDFYSLVEYLDQQGKLLHVLTPNQHYSNLYNAYEKYIVRLDKSRSELAYRDKKRRSRSAGRGKPHKQQSS